MTVTLPEPGPRQRRIWALAQALQSHGYVSEVAGDKSHLEVPASEGPPVQVRCDHRALCGGELWFYFPAGIPIAQADDEHLAEVVVAIKGKLVAQRGTSA